mgnify:CR=1 FL=1
MTITKKPIPNHSDRQGWSPIAVVVHIADGSKESVLQEFCSSTLKSSHYLVNRDGSVWQFVDEVRCAWANGTVTNPSSELVKARGGINPNFFTISIEHEDYRNGENLTDITEAQYQTSAELIYDICQRWNIPLDRKHVIRHNQINSLKSCPEDISIERLISLAIQVPEKRRQAISLLQRLIALYRQLVALLVKGRR